MGLCLRHGSWSLCRVEIVVKELRELNAAANQVSAGVLFFF